MLRHWLAQTSQEEVLRSISENVGASVDGNKLLAVLCAILATVILVALIGQRRKRQVTRKAMNHPGKLMKDIGKSLQLRPEQMKKLKTLAQQKNVQPLTLLLCPSLLASAMKKKSADATRENRG